jgi:hypothetical protein
MNRLQHHLFRWLALTALADWLVVRTLARSAIFMPKSPIVLWIYQSLTLAGQVASILAAMLGLAGLGWIAWQSRARDHGLLSLALVGLVF